MEQVVAPGIVAFLVTFLGLAYLEAPFFAWASVLVLTLGVIHGFQIFSWSVLTVLWAILIFGIVILGFSPLRQRWITRGIARKIKNVLPPMSMTEQEALEAGEIWWEGQLFQGRPDWQALLALPKPHLTEEERYFTEHTVNELCAMIQDWTDSQVNLDLSPAVWNFLKENRFFGIIIPKKYGGLEFSALAHSTIVQKIATRSLTAAITTMVPNSLGPAELLINYGTEEQKQYYLPRLAVGLEIPCFALTSPEAGSDASAIKDTGIVCEGEFQGKKILGIKLAWNKRYITLAPVATVLGLAFKLYDPHKLLGEEPALGITVCLVPTNHPGVEIGLRHFPLHQAFMNGPTRGHEVFVPLDWVIGGKKMIGKGWRMLVERLSVGRGISLPALSAATAKHCYRTAGAYTQIRQQFHTPICRFEGVEASLAKIAGLTYMIEATRLLTLTALDQHIHPSIVTAIVKYHLTEMSRLVINHAMDVHGGKAIMLGPNNYLSHCYESIPISITVEGANILTRNLIIFGQGVIRCHPYIQQELQAVQPEEVKEAVKRLDKVFFKHIRYTLANLTRGLVHALTAGWFCRAPKVKPFKKYYRQLGRMSIALSWVADVALILLGGKLKRRERLSARLGDVLSYLYMASAVLKYYQDVGNKKEDVVYVAWCVEFCLYQIQNAFLEFFANFPMAWLGRFFRFLVFPYGRPYALPGDRLEHQVVSSMLPPSEFRDRLTDHYYLSKINDHPVAHLEYTLNQLMLSADATVKLETAVKKGMISRALDIQEKIEKALSDKIITKEEAYVLSVTEKARAEVLRVDEFPAEQLVRKKTL